MDYLCLQEQYKLCLSNVGENGVLDEPTKLRQRHNSQLFGAVQNLVWANIWLPVVGAALRLLLRTLAHHVVHCWGGMEHALKRAHFHNDTISEQLVYRYKLPSLVHNWEDAFARLLCAHALYTPREHSDATSAFLHRHAAMVMDSVGETCMLQTLTRAAAQQDQSNVARNPSGQRDAAWLGTTLLSRFQDQLHKHRVPVLIVHGEQDAIVPVGNSCRMSAMLQVPVLKLANCGHSPHEEMPSAFVELVTALVRDVTGQRDEADTMGRSLHSGGAVPVASLRVPLNKRS